MKNNRQSMILDIIAKEHIETQEQLLEQLRKRGVASTQATISRDIKQLHLVKEPTGHGTYKYAVSSSRARLNIADKLRTIFHESITSVDCAQNIVVFKTLAGLAGGDIPNEMIPFAAKHAMVAIDVQTMLRWVENGGMVYHDWKEKKELLPYIRFLKTDAAEAEIMTGCTDRKEAAKHLYSWGAKEILITHNTEVLAYDGNEFHTCPIRARNLSSRTGRGDTTFAAYINERLSRSVPEALLTATATVSLKMETPGPLKGNRADIEKYIDEFYPDFK